MWEVSSTDRNALFINKQIVGDRRHIKARLRLHRLCFGNKAIRDGRPRPPRHQVGWDIVTRECACQISWWSVEKWRRYYILKFRGNTFRWPMTLTFDLKFWKYLSVTVYPYVICMPSFIMIGWEMAEILHFEILRKHGQTHTQTHTQTNKQTWALQYLALPLWGAR